MEERRTHFLINKPLQLRYMFYITITIVVISGVSLMSLYVGIWGSVLDSFANDQIRQDMLTAARMSQYENARFAKHETEFGALSFFKQVEKLSIRQREVFKSILDASNKGLALKLLFLFIFIAWGSVFLSHKIAGPLYRFHATLLEIQKGNFRARIKLRKGDEGQALVDDFNRALTYLDVHTSRIKNIVRENENKPDRLITQLKEELAKINTSVDK